MSAGRSEVVDEGEVSSAKTSVSMFLELVGFVRGGVTGQLQYKALNCVKRTKQLSRPVIYV